MSSFSALASWVHRSHFIWRSAKLARLSSSIRITLGTAVELIDKHQLRELEPDWNVADMELVAYEPDSGYGDGAGVAGDSPQSIRRKCSDQSGI